MNARHVTPALVAMTLLAPCRAVTQAPTDPPVWRPVIMGTQAMIAAEHPLEALAAEQVLRAGGNAIDAAVAAFYMTTVVEHHQAGIGGDAFILAYIAKENRVVFINGTGVAPSLATVEKYRSLGGIPDTGPFASSVPGAVAGFDLALKTYGTRTYAQLLQPATDAALNGHPLSVWGASMHANSVNKVAKYPGSARVLLRGGKAPLAGDRFVQADLGKTLQMIAERGADAFYRGAIAERIDTFYQEHGGLIRREDLAGIRAEEAPPVETSYRGYQVYQSAPNSQGIAMLIALEILEGFDLKAMGQNSATYVHVITEAIKLAFADRNQYIADPRVVKDIPVAELLSPKYAEARRALIRMDAAMDSLAPPGDPRRGLAVLAGHRVNYRTGASPVGPSEQVQPTEQGETSSFAIADRFGNVVSVTHSVNGTFGSGMIVDGLGFVLNNRMPYFSLEDGDVNQLAPGKRPRHTINPALALRDGKPFLAWNTPGGDNQPQAMLQAFLNVVEFGMNVQQAAEAANINSYQMRSSFDDHASRPGRLLLQEEVPDWVRSELRRMGYTLEFERLTSGPINAIFFDSKHGTFWGGSSTHGEDYGIAW